MTVREYLGQIWEINERINKELRKLEDIKSRLYSSGIDYSKPRVQTSPRDTMAHIYAEIDEQERYVTELIDKLADLKATVTEQINGIETPLCRYVLHQLCELHQHDRPVGAVPHQPHDTVQDTGCGTCRIWPTPWCRRDENT